ncbi:MAG TPA: DedA family protein [Desulfobacteria bacterium]|nr:DedA family protein [Desulfobacteria bacterium]
MKELAFHLIATYKYVGLFLSLALGLLGIPIPDETIMTFVGFLVYRQKLSLLLTVLVSIFGSLSGMSLSFVIGRKIGYRFLAKFGAYIHLTPAKLEKHKGWFDRYGARSIVIGYFVPGVRHVTAYLAGITDVPYSRFISIAAVGAATWVVTFVTLGMIVGKDWFKVGLMVHRYFWYLLFVVLVAAAVISLVQRKHKPERS